jgi:4-amino-4-deoxy-L-arabinose transferase-like glycosyltransferase
VISALRRGRVAPPRRSGLSAAQLAASWWPLGSLAALLGALVFLLSRQLEVRSVSDEGVYVLSVQALEHGEALGRDVFVSQPPGFYLWLRWIAAVLGDSLHDVRVGMILTVALAAVALFVVGRALTATLGGLAAVALLAITTPLPTEGIQVYADTPAYALAAVAVACAAVRRPALAGIALTASLSVKLSAVTAVPAVLALVYVRSQRPWAGIARLVAGAIVTAAAIALVFVRDLSQIWSGVVGYHVTAYQYAGFSAERRLGNWASYDSPYFYFALIGLVVTLTRARSLWPLWLWPLAGVAFIAVHKPLHDNHMLVLPYSVACAAGPSLGKLVEGLRPRFAVGLVALGALAAVGGYVQQYHWATSLTKGEDESLVAAAKALDRVTKPGDLVVSDQAIVALMAHRDVPAELVDPSIQRFGTGSLTPAKVERIIEAQPVRAVVVARAFALPPVAPLLPYLRRGFVHVLHLRGATIFYGRRQSLGSPR